MAKLVTKPLLAVTASLLLAGLLALPSFTPAPSAAQELPAGAAPALTSAGINLRHTVTVDVVKRVAPAVVYISTERIYERPVVGLDVFGRVRRGTQKESQNSLGSGFIIHESGYIVTNNHVIEQATSVNVTLHDQKTPLKARVIAADPDTDLAILKIESKTPLPALALGDSSDLMIGEPVIAVGNPLGFSSSVSTGIVSAIHREIQPSPERTLKDLIQTDAAINPGNSGGPLLNAYGQVIGINTAIVNEAQNIGFAIQVNRLRELLPQLMNPERSRWYDTPFTLSETRTLTPPATVTAKVDITTKAGKRRISKIAGKTPRDIVDALALIAAQPDDRPIKIETDGGGDALAFNPIKRNTTTALATAKTRLGITVQAVTPAVAEQYDLLAEEGMLITEVSAKSPAEKAGLRPGDVILAMGRGRVHNAEDFTQLIAEATLANGKVVLNILRKNRLYETNLDL